MLILCSKTYCCYDVGSYQFNFSSKGSNKRILERSGDGRLEKNKRVLKGKMNITSTNSGFRTQKHVFATYEETSKGLSYFQPKQIVEADGILTLPFPL